MKLEMLYWKGLAELTQVWNIRNFTVIGYHNSGLYRDWLLVCHMSHVLCSWQAAVELKRRSQKTREQLSLYISLKYIAKSDL
jgi:hypothetical protein